MNALLDLIIVIIAGLTIFFAAKNGFVKTLLSTSAFFIALIITISLMAPLKNAFMNSSAADNIRGHVETSLLNIIDNNDLNQNIEVSNIDNSTTNVSDESFNIDATIAKDSNMNDFFNALEKIGISKEELQTKADEWKAEKGADLKQKLVEYLADPIVDAIITIIVISLLFFGSLILLKIATYVLNKVCKLPVLRTANTLLGVVLGIILAVVRVYLFCIIVKALLPYGQAMDVGLFGAIDTSKTLLFNIFYNFNIFDFLLK